MAIGKTDIFVYAHWLEMAEPKLIGILSAHHGKGRKSISFEYDPEWIRTEKFHLLDPDITWNNGQQFSGRKENFGVFNDAMPDTWGRTLMKRREAQLAKDEKRAAKTLHDIDFLLGVNDESRMGGLRFKADKNGPFLNDDNQMPTPPWASVRELQQGVSLIESNKNDKEVKKWLAVLLAPGSSLGGARPKANIVDEKGALWIAKFPSKDDVIDKAAWEYLAYKLALKAGVEMSECKIQKITGKHHTFFTKRFDRLKSKRIHFASAMTMTGNNEDTIKENPAGYLDIAEFIQFNALDNTKELHQLWRRIVFNIAVSNTDDHLRNHGFLLHENGWKLSPAYDINPSTDKDGLALNIDTNDNSLDFDLAKSVGEYFQLNNIQMNQILKEVKTAVKNWKKEAEKIGIARSEQEMMAAAFRHQ
ncbi:MAG: putative DNA-binding transcriptional regulator [Bacteroidetes bacterium]|nr:putative DNA-binding transcriptional regulator [Bacteroidota bacterium]